MKPNLSDRPRLVATDLDGTLLRPDGTVGERTVAAIATCEAAGSVLVLATGRPPRWTDSIGDLLNHQGLAVCANGALVYDLARREVVSSHTMVQPDAASIINTLRRGWPDVVFAVETVDHLGLEAGWQLNWEPPAGTRFGDALDLIETPVLKLLAKLDAGPMEPALARIAAELDGLAEVTWSGAKNLLEMSAPGVSKGVALAELALSLGIEAVDAIAFGDMPNDLDMLRWAGRGLAMANAHSVVREAADEIIGSNEDEGVAAYLKTRFG